MGWLRDVDPHLIGPVIYEEMAEAWRTSDDPQAAPMNDIPKIVFTRTLERADWVDSRRPALVQGEPAAHQAVGLGLREVTAPASRLDARPEQ